MCQTCKKVPGLATRAASRTRARLSFWIKTCNFCPHPQRQPRATQMNASRIRAERWLGKLWGGTDLHLVPYDRPPPPEAAAPPRAAAPAAPEPAPAPAPAAEDVQMKERLDALLGIPSSRGPLAAAPRKRSLLPLVDQQIATHTKGVAVVEHLTRLGRGGDVGKRHKRPGSFRTAQLELRPGDGICRKELAAIGRSQAFSDCCNRPVIIAQSITEWRAER